MRATRDHAHAIVGIDCHAERHVAAIATWSHLADGANWRTLPVRAVTNTRASYDALAAAIADTGTQPPNVLAALDRTGAYSESLARYLRRAGINLTWIDPHQAKADRDRWRTDKTDEGDARLFAFTTYERLAQAEKLLIDTTDPELDDRAAEIRALLSLHHQAKRETTRTTNRLRALATRAWPEVADGYYGWWARIADRCPNAAAYPQAAASLPAATRRTLAPLAHDSVGDQSTHIADAIRLTARALSAARAMEDEVHQRLTAAVRSHPYHPILTSFPGIADGHAAAIIATVTDAHRVETPKGFRSLCGYGSWRRQSGTTDTTFARPTAPRAKSALFLAVLSQLTRTPDNPYARLYRRRRSRGRLHFQAAFAAAGLMAEHIWHCLTRGTPYRAPTPAQEHAQ